MKSFFIGESVRPQFGVDFFNIFNRHQWIGLRSNIGDPAGFGRFSNANAPRTIQFWLKVNF